VHLFDVLHERFPFFTSGNISLKKYTVDDDESSSDSDGHTPDPGESLVSPARRRLLKRASGSTKALQAHGHDHLHTCSKSVQRSRPGITNSKDMWQAPVNHSTDIAQVVIAHKIKSRFGRQTRATTLVSHRETSPARLRDAPVAPAVTLPG